MKKIKTKEEQARHPYTFRKKALEDLYNAFNYRLRQKLIKKLKAKHKQESQIITDREFTIGFVIMFLVIILSIYI